MIFSKKEKHLVAYTVEKCPTCKQESKRKFRQGDCLFVESSKCTFCNIPTNITKIFGEPIE
jgi:hypothetical protein